MKMMNKVTFLKRYFSDVLTYQAKMINFTCFHTESEVFFQIKFHPWMKLMCKQKFFHPRTSINAG